MAKFLRRFVKRRDAALPGQPEQPRLETENEVPRTEAIAEEGEMELEETHLRMQELLSGTQLKTRLTALY